MRDALTVIGDTLRDWYNGMVGLAGLNLLWVLAALTVILLPPATAGVFVVTHSIARGTGQHASDFIEGARRYLLHSYAWALANGIAAGIVWANVQFYGGLGGGAAFVMQMFTALLLTLWIAMQVYFWPFLIEQDTKSLRLAWKNALFLTLANPAYTLILLAASGAAVLLSALIILPLGVFTLTFLALLANRATRERLIAFGKLAHPPAPESEEGV